MGEGRRWQLLWCIRRGNGTSRLSGFGAILCTLDDAEVANRARAKA
jgi:hypothetical protein